MSALPESKKGNSTSVTVLFVVPVASPAGMTRLTLPNETGMPGAAVGVLVFGGMGVKVGTAVSVAVGTEVSVAVGSAVLVGGMGVAVEVRNGIGMEDTLQARAMAAERRRNANILA